MTKECNECLYLWNSFLMRRPQLRVRHGCERRNFPALPLQTVQARARDVLQLSSSLSPSRHCHRGADFYCTGRENYTYTRLREYCRQVEAEEVRKSSLPALGCTIFTFHSVTPQLQNEIVFHCSDIRLNLVQDAVCRDYKGGRQSTSFSTICISDKR